MLEFATATTDMWMDSFVFSPVNLSFLNCFTVGSVTETETYDSMTDFRDQIFRIKENGDSRVPFILVGNKVDLVQKRCVRVEQAENLARQWNCPYFEASAKTMINIDQIFFEVMGQIKTEFLTPEAVPLQSKKKVFRCHRRRRCSIL